MLWLFLVVLLLISLTELEKERGNTAAHPGQDAAHSRACVPQHSGEEFRGVDIHQGGASGHGKLPYHLQSHGQGGEAWYEEEEEERKEKQEARKNIISHMQLHNIPLTGTRGETWEKKDKLGKTASVNCSFNSIPLGDTKEIRPGGKEEGKKLEVRIDGSCQL